MADEGWYFMANICETVLYNEKQNKYFLRGCISFLSMFERGFAVSASLAVG